MAGPLMTGVVPDLQLNEQLKRDEERNMRMTAFSMIMDMQSRGVPVVDVEDKTGKPLSGATILGNMHDAVKKWSAYITSGQAIGGG